MVLEVSPLGWGIHAEAKNLFEADVVGEKGLLYIGKRLQCALFLTL